jgi:nicotinate-nucleotide pyrophosphorylase (carboxylating)
MSIGQSFLIEFGAQSAIKNLVENAILEDLAQGDITTDNLPKLTEIACTGLFRVRQACVVSGLQVAAQVCKTIDPALQFQAAIQDGDRASAGQVIATVTGSMASILKAERTALNFLQHLCGIATETRRYADALAGTKTKITHTRKTTPGLRLLEHRFNLGSCVMLKDNHLQALCRHGAMSLADAIQQLRARLSHTAKIEVEADTLEQVQQAADAGADIILLDNMTPEQIREALRIINGRAITEASGGITLETIRAYAETGVDCISTSKITLGVPAVDIGLDLE